MTTLELTDTIPPAACPLGYPREQVEQIVAEKWDEFAQWMRGQTTAICDGRRYDHEAREYVPTQCAESPHGVVIYPWDIAQFVRGGQPLD